MDRVWEEYGLDNTKPLESQAVEEFYSHPIWLVNGVFTALDTVSVEHRASIARCLADIGASDIADYGGGFGELAFAVRRVIPDARITIIEPYPTQVSMERLSRIGSIDVRSNVGYGYDAVVAQDVLEHVEDPVGLAYEIADSVREGGEVIFANCFRPVIKCHLPCTFHLKHTFRFVMSLMGLRYNGKVEGAAHALRFERRGNLNRSSGRRAEHISKTVFAALTLWQKADSAAKRK